MSTIERAVQIAAQAHEGQADENGGHYLHHPLNVMHRVTGEEAKIVAVLHDVVEDSDWSFASLADEGFGSDIIESLRCLTHIPDETYAHYVIRCKANSGAREVKLADLHDNARLDRVLARPDSIDSDLRRVHRYILSYRFLTDQLSEQQYLELMEQYG